MPNSAASVGKQLLVGRVVCREWGSNLWVHDGLWEGRRQVSVHSQSLNKMGGVQELLTSSIIHTLMVFLVFVWERTLAVLSVHFQLSSRDREVWREANVRYHHEETNAAAAVLVSEEWSGAWQLWLGFSGDCSVVGHLQRSSLNLYQL